MTIKQKAAELGVTYQALYKRLKVKGLSAKDLTTETGELTEEGERILAELYPEERKPGTDGEAKPKPAEELASLRLRAGIAEARANVAEKRIEQLEEERDYLRAALEREQEINRQQAQALTAASVKNLQMITGEKKRGLLAPLREIFQGKHKHEQAEPIQAEQIQTEAPEE